MRNNLSLSAKINIIILVAVLLPLGVFGLLTIRTVNNLALENLESFVLENGSRRQAAIESDLQSALNTLNEYIAANESSLLLALEQQATGIFDTRTSEVEDSIQRRMRTQLIDTRLYNSVRLLSEFYFPFTTVVRQDQTAPGTLQAQESIVRTIAERLDIANGDIQVFGITDRDNTQRVEVLTALTSEDANGDPVILGYLLVDLNLDEIFTNNLAVQDAIFETYAYVIVARDAQRIVFAPDEVLDNNLYDVNSPGAVSALNNRASSVDLYDIVADDGSTRRVAGYHGTLRIDNELFAVVTEVNTREVFTNIIQQTVSQIFVGVIVLTVIVLIMGLLAANQLIMPPIRSLRTAILAVIRGDFDVPVAGANRQDELGSLGTSFIDMRQYIRELNDDMNRRLQERTRDVQITQDIAKAATAERDLNTLMTRVVTLIVQNFPSVYHAQIFLVDSDNQFAVLRASTGAAGRELLSRGHKLAVGSVSVIGQVTEQGQVIIARDTAESNLHRQNEFLGETRAELAIPLRLGDTITGALDVQSKQRDSFDSDQVTALQTLADQITIAIENARLYAESERLLKETENERAHTTRQAWQQYLYQLRQSDMTISSGTRTGHNFQRLSTAVMQSGEPVIGDVTVRNTIPFVVPVKLRNETLGVVEYEVPQADFEYDKVLLAQELVSRLAISLENARLFQASQQATDRERIVNDISAKLTNQTDIEGILQTAVREIEQALRTPQVAIRLTTSPNGSNNGNGNHAGPDGNYPDNSSL